MTVSRVLRGRGEASAETRERILAVARELGYVPVPPPVWQSRRVETRIIGLLFDGWDFEDFGMLAGYRGMRVGAEDNGYDLLTLRQRRPDNWPPEREEIRFMDRRCDAFIFIVPVDRHNLMETLVRNGIPVVSYGVEDVPSGVGYVTADNEGVTRQAVEHLVELGHRQIGHIAGQPDRSYFKRRQVGFRLAMAEAGLDADRACISEGQPFDYAQSADQMAHLAAKGHITAVACANDQGALMLWERAEALGLRVPQDLSIVGVDDIPEAERRGLTSFHLNGEAAGHAMIDATAAALSGAPPWQKIEPFKLVRRDSVAQPRH